MNEIAYIEIAMIMIFIIIECGIFLACVKGLRYAYEFFKKKSNARYLNAHEYLPEEEIHTLKQVYYLIVMTLLLINLLFIFILWNNEIYHYAIFEFIISIIVCESMPKETFKDKLMIFSLIPFSAMMMLLTGGDKLILLDYVRIAGLIYGIKFYYDRFEDYTNNNSLGYAILLLFSIIFFSVFITSFTEHIDLFDALVMVSNAFTSNGYAILGNTTWGKIDSIILVWSGYIISGAATATLAAAIIIQHYTKKIQHFEKEITEIKEMLKELKEKE